MTDILRYDNQSGLLGAYLPAEGGTNTYNGFFQVAPDFDDISEPQFLKIVLDADTATFEIVYLIFYAQGSLNVTLLRGQEGTTPQPHNAVLGTWGCSPTAADFTPAAIGADPVGSAATAQSNAEAFATAADGVVLSEAETFATGAANTAQSNAETFATEADTVVLSEAETFASGAASTAQSNAETYAAAQAATAQSNAETYTNVQIAGVMKLIYSHVTGSGGDPAVLDTGALAGVLHSLYIEAEARSSNSGTPDFALQFNGDTAEHYGRSGIYLTYGSSPAAFSSASLASLPCGRLAGSGDTAGVLGSIEVKIPAIDQELAQYDSQFTGGFIDGASGNGLFLTGSGVWIPAILQRITSVQFVDASGGGFVAGSVFRIYTY